MTEYDREANVSIEQADGTTIIKCDGMFDLHNYGRFHEALADAVAAGDNVVVDFLATAYIDTAVLADLATAANKMIARGKRLQVKVAEPTHPHRTLQITGFSAVLDVLVSPKQ